MSMIREITRDYTIRIGNIILNTWDSCNPVYFIGQVIESDNESVFIIHNLVLNSSNKYGHGVLYPKYNESEYDIIMNDGEIYEPY